MTTYNVVINDNTTGTIDDSTLDGLSPEDFIGDQNPGRLHRSSMRSSRNPMENSVHDREFTATPHQPGARPEPGYTLKDPNRRV